MDRFFSKLDLRDIKIKPEGSRFLPDDDEAELVDEPAVASVPIEEETIETRSRPVEPTNYRRADSQRTCCRGDLRANRSSKTWQDVPARSRDASRSHRPVELRITMHEVLEGLGQVTAERGRRRNRRCRSRERTCRSSGDRRRRHQPGDQSNRDCARVSARNRYRRDLRSGIYRCYDRQRRAHRHSAGHRAPLASPITIGGP